MEKKTQFQIASLSEGNKSAYDAAGNRYFLPERFRKNAKVGDFCIVKEQTFKHRTKIDPATGAPVLGADGKPVMEDVAEWTRQDVTFVGTQKDMVIAASETKIIAATSDAIVNAHIANLLKEIQSTPVDVKALEEATV